MKKIHKYSILTLLFIIIASCDGPTLLVLNRVHSDGSVSRKIIMTWDTDEFDLSIAQVPIDSTWNISEKMSISESSDTLYTLTAEKHFDSVEEINQDYIEFGGSNDHLTRGAEFESRFKWFNTTYYYAENIGKAIDGYPPGDYFSDDEINVFYMPDEILQTHLNGIDSTFYKKIVDSMEEKNEMWMGQSLIKATMLKVVEISKDSADPELQYDFLLSKEEELANILFEMDLNEEEIIDTVFGDGFFDRHQNVLDSAFASLETEFNISLETDDYLLQTIMPGELVATNGYIDTEGNINWKVNGDVILTTDYTMWAESSETNWWAWIVTGLFLLFVVVGLIIRLRR